MITNNTFEEILQAVNTATTVAVVCHYNPDGDAIGSGLSLYRALNNIGKKAYMFCDDAIKGNITTFTGVENINAESLEKYDMAIAVDCAELKRTGKYASLFLQKDLPTVAIDHHATHVPFAKYVYVDPTAAATCEILYELIVKMGGMDQIVAQNLFLGIVTDSGCFSFSNTTTRTFNVAAELRKYDFNASEKIYNVFKKVEFPVFKMRNEVLAAASFSQNDKVAIATIPQEILNKYGLDKSSSEGLVNMLLDVDRVCIAVVMLQMAGNTFKVSIRSKAPAQAVKIAECFGGGGHVLAAGCQINGNIFAVKEKLERYCSIELERAGIIK